MKNELAPLIWVDTTEKLDRMVQALMRQKAVAIDTESNSLYAYQEQVCLIQFTAAGRDYLLDPLAFDSLEALRPLLADPGIQKIFHAAEYDLICLKRDYSFTFNNLFDTMIAARTLGMKSIGLAALLEHFFNVHLNKKYQRANWGQRPLKQEMLDYARLDSHYLIELRDQLLVRLRDEHRLKLLEEDCARLSQNCQPMPNHQADIWRVKGATDLAPRQLCALQSLHDLREEIAKKLDRPPFKVLSNQALLEVAQTLPRYFEELKLLPSLSESQARHFGKDLLSAVKNSKNMQNIPHNHYQKPDRVFLQRKDTLGEWRKKTGEKIGVPSDVILPRESMVAIAENDPQNLAELKDIMADTPVRFNTYGSEILDKLKGL